MGLKQLASMFGGTVAYGSFGRSTGAEGLSRVELAGLLAGLSQAEQDYLYAFFGDASSAQRLRDYVCDWAIGVAGRESWKASADMPLMLSSIAVSELLHNRCGACHGTGVKGIKVCCRCGGIGQGRLSSRAMAAKIGVDQSNYLRTWRVRYDRIYVYAQDVECAALMKVRRAQNREVSLLA